MSVNELVDNYVPGSVAKHAHKTKLEEYVFKATQSKPAPAKPKYARAILIETWSAATGGHVFQELFKRPLGGKEIVLFKTLIVVHQLLRDGHPNCLEDAWNRKDFLESLAAQFQGTQTAIGTMDGAYLDFLIEKIKFHKAQPTVGGEILLQKFKEKHKKFNAKNVLAMVKGLLHLQKTLLAFQQKVLQSQGLQPYRLAGIVPCVVESYAIYTMTEYFLRKLSEIDIEQDDINDMIDQFLQQYPIIQKFYFQAGTIPYVTREITVPTLSEQPPKFERNTEKKKKRRDTATQKKNLLTPDITGSGPGSDILNSTYGINPTTPAQPLLLNDPFANRGFGGPGQYNPFAAAPVQPAVDPYALAAAQARLAEQQQRESEAVLRERIRQLEARLAELRQRLNELESENVRLNQELSQRDGGLATTRAQLEQQLNKEQEHFMNESQRLKKNLQDREVQYEKEKLNLIGQQILFSKSSIDKHLSKFDDPSYAGNKSATGEDIVRGVLELKQKYEGLYTAIETEGDTVGASRALATQVTRTLDDIKGTLSKIDDPALRLQLSEYGRDVAQESSKLLGYTKQLGKRKPNETEHRFLSGERETFNGLIKSIQQTIEDSQRRAEDTGDLEDLASRELGAAARVIEEAAAALLRQSELRKLQGPGIEGEDVEGTIMEAALQVTKTTQQLVKSAIATQQERVKEGLVAASSTGEKYSANPMWTEGLISAGKGVAEATRQLVIYANKAAQGQVDDAALIAAARAVNKPTAQLISATHSTALNSQAGLAIQATLDASANAVTRAATGLVDAAKLYTRKQEQTSIRDSVGLASRVGAEMIQTTKVQQLQVDLEEARKQLFDKRREEYSGATARPAAVATGPVRKTSSSVRPDAAANITVNATVDTSSISGTFGQNFRDQDESQVRVPTYMQKIQAGLEHGRPNNSGITAAALLQPRLPSAPSFQPPDHVQAQVQVQVQVPPTSPFFSDNTNSGWGGQAPPATTNPFGNSTPFGPTPTQTGSGATTSNPFLT